MWKARLGTAALLGWLALGSRATGHGGVIPIPPPPPPPPADPRTETIKHVNTSGGNPGAPTTAGGQTGGAGIKGGGPTTGRRAPAETFDRWEFWWEANQELYLRPRTAHAAITPAAPSDPPVRRVSFDDARARILPALLAAMSSREADVADSSVLAFASVIPAEQANLALTPLRRALDHEQRTVRESAALALGIVGSPDAAPSLRALLADGDEGRRLAGRPNGVEENVRAFAAAALGLIGDPSALEELERAIDPQQGPTSRNIAQLALLSIGLLHGRDSERAAFLTKTMGRRGIDPVVRAHAPIALAHLAASPEGEAAARGILGALVTLLEDAATEVDLRRSVAIALGRLARMEDGEAIAALRAAVERGKDGPARQFALIALGEIGARDGDARRHGDAQAQLERFLVGQLVEPDRPSLRPFAALALGIWGRNEALLPDARERAIAKLLEQLAADRSGSDRGALALALGLLDAREAMLPLAHAFAGAREEGFKGHVALALGLLRAHAHAEMLRDELARPGNTPMLEVQLARALALMGDARAVPVLLERLARADTFAEFACVGAALGWVGDQGAIDPLLAVLADEKAPSARRGVAATALGLLAAKSELRWSVPFVASSNYCARAASLAEIADLL